MTHRLKYFTDQTNRIPGIEFPLLGIVLSLSLSLSLSLFSVFSQEAIFLFFCKHSVEVLVYFKGLDREEM
jgi:hypothetical protein